jgi:hypothetical protein
MDYVYICRAGDNEELRYSIRSVVKYATHDNIWVIGSKPDWYIGNYIKIEDVGDKFDNITNCYKIISSIGAVSEDFVLMNDDFFILKPLGKMPIFYDGTLANKIDSHMSANGLSKYARVLIKAKKELIKNGIEEPLCYDIHVPMVFNKTMLSYMEYSNNAPRSMYGNIYKVGGINVNDVKIYKNNSSFNFEESHFISTEDSSFNLIKDQLRILFPDKTIFEKE